MSGDRPQLGTGRALNRALIVSRGGWFLTGQEQKELGVAYGARRAGPLFSCPQALKPRVFFSPQAARHSAKLGIRL